jgi:putative ABC transport system permease protein
VSAAKVAVLGSVVRDQLFGPGTDPTGATIRIKNQPFRVVGVLTSKGQAAMGPDQDDTVIVPYTTVQKKLLGITHLQNITLSTADGVPFDQVSEALTTTLRTRHQLTAGAPDDFTVRSLEEMATVLTSTTTTMTWLLASIAAVSLLVGGIGIMNIMLVSVTERTREIGIRLAIGALAREVRMQFLTEAVVLCCFGGLIGILLAFGLSLLLAKAIDVPFVFSLPVNVLSFVFSALMGIIFGYYPARRASRLDPIEALRHE